MGMADAHMHSAKVLLCQRKFAYLAKEEPVLQPVLRTVPLAGAETPKRGKREAWG